VKNNYKTQKKLEKIIKTSFESSSDFLLKICQKIFNFCDRENYFKIWKKTNRFGGIYWQVYNERTGQYSYFSSEAEVRFWIEQQFYQC
jgi:hypothetical protein